MAIPHGTREAIARAAAELAAVAPFSELSPVDRARLAATLEEVIYQPGEVITHRQARPMAVAYGLVMLLALCASVPLWRAMGLL